MYNDLSMSHLNGIDFKYLKRGNNVYHLKITQEGKNITARFKGLVGNYNSDKNYLIVCTNNIESICCYLIECYEG